MVSIVLTFTWQGVGVGMGCILLSGESNDFIYNDLNEVHDNLICTSINAIYCRVCS